MSSQARRYSPRLTQCVPTTTCIVHNFKRQSVVPRTQWRQFESLFVHARAFEAWCSVVQEPYSGVFLNLRIFQKLCVPTARPPRHYTPTIPQISRLSHTRCLNNILSLCFIATDTSMSKFETVSTFSYGSIKMHFENLSSKAGHAYWILCDDCLNDCPWQFDACTFDISFLIIIYFHNCLAECDVRKFKKPVKHAAWDDFSRCSQSRKQMEHVFHTTHMRFTHGATAEMNEISSRFAVSGRKKILIIMVVRINKCINTWSETPRPINFGATIRRQIYADPKTVLKTHDLYLLFTCLRVCVAVHLTH